MSVMHIQQIYKRSIVDIGSIMISCVRVYLAHTSHRERACAVWWGLRHT